MRRHGRQSEREPEEFLLPNSTQIPDTMLDLWMGLFRGEAPFKILMYIARRTFGFRKSADNLSIPQICTGIVTKEGERLDWGTQLGRRTVEVTLAELVARGVVRRQINYRDNGQQAANTYSLNLAWVPDWEPGQSPPPLPKVPESGFGDPPQDLRTYPEPGFGDPPESGCGGMCLGSPNQDSDTTPSSTRYRGSSSSNAAAVMADPASPPLHCVLPDAAAAAADSPHAAADTDATPASDTILPPGGQRLREAFPAMRASLAMELAERAGPDGVERWILRAMEVAEEEGVSLASKARLVIACIRAGDPPPDVAVPEAGRKGGVVRALPPEVERLCASDRRYDGQPEDTLTLIARTFPPVNPEAVEAEREAAMAELQAMKWGRKGAP